MNVPLPAGKESRLNRAGDNMNVPLPAGKANKEAGFGQVIKPASAKE